MLRRGATAVAALLRALRLTAKFVAISEIKSVLQETLMINYSMIIKFSRSEVKVPVKSVGKKKKNTKKTYVPLHQGIILFACPMSGNAFT